MRISFDTAATANRLAEKENEEARQKEQKGTVDERRSRGAERESRYYGGGVGIYGNSRRNRCVSGTDAVINKGPLI